MNLLLRKSINNLKEWKVFLKDSTFFNVNFYRSEMVGYDEAKKKSLKRFSTKSLSRVPENLLEFVAHN